MGQAAWQIQLLALNAFFDLAHSSRESGGTVAALERVSTVAERSVLAPASLSPLELDSAYAALLYHSLLS